jgi:hypothetical protein
MAAAREEPRTEELVERAKFLRQEGERLRQEGRPLLAVDSLDAADELLLRALALARGMPWSEVRAKKVGELVRVLSLPPKLGKRVMGVRGVRNLARHEGREPSPQELSEAEAVSRSLFDWALPQLSRGAPAPAPPAPPRPKEAKPRARAPARKERPQRLRESRDLSLPPSPPPRRIPAAGTREPLRLALSLSLAFFFLPLDLAAALMVYSRGWWGPLLSLHLLLLAVLALPGLLPLVGLFRRGARIEGRMLWALAAPWLSIFTLYTFYHLDLPPSWSGVSLYYLFFPLFVWGLCSYLEYLPRLHRIPILLPPLLYSGWRVRTLLSGHVTGGSIGWVLYISIYFIFIPLFIILAEDKGKKVPKILRQTWRGWRCEYMYRTPDGKVVVGFTTPGGLWEEARVRNEKEAAKLRLQVESLEAGEE